MFQAGLDTIKAKKNLTIEGKDYAYYDIKIAAQHYGDISRLPFSLKILLENMLRFQDDRSVFNDDIKAIIGWQKEKRSEREIAFRPARVLMQDFTGVPAVADLAAMRDQVKKMGGDPRKINPLSQVDLVIDHSVMIDYFGTKDAFAKNVALEFERNGERYEFLRWGQNSFDNFRVVPPGTGICHQVNIEYLARTIWSDTDQHGVETLYPDSLVGTDSHTTMANGLGILGWGVGGIEAEAAMLGQPISMVIPEVIGFKVTGQLREGMTATDLVLRCVEMLRKKGVVNKFVEFFGDGLANLSLADRATIANMAPEYGATCGIFPIDRETINYMRLTGRSPLQCAIVEQYARAQGMWHDTTTPEAIYTDILQLDLSDVEPAVAGPKRPQDRVNLSATPSASLKITEQQQKSVPVKGTNYAIQDHSVVIAAITSCTNTSNPAVLIAAGLLAKKARALGLTSKPWVKTSLAPGSQVVQDYLIKAGLQDALDELGFQVVGFGCTTCIGNAGPLHDDIVAAIDEGQLTVAAVLSGNRNFEGRISPNVKANWLASPPLVVAYALAGATTIDILNQPLANDKNGNPVYLKDIWPSNAEIKAVMQEVLTPELFTNRYGNVFAGTKEWQAVKVSKSETYDWNGGSTYVRRPPFFEGMEMQPKALNDIKGAKILAMLADSITTDHISPAGSFKEKTPAGQYLTERQVRPIDFNSYGARRGNHEVMMRGTFANIRIKNEIIPDGREGGLSVYKGEVMPMYNAAMAYINDGVDLVVVAGKEYGTGSSRDWAAKGTQLLGIKCVIAESFERIHRSNLVGMGVLPLEFPAGVTRQSLGLQGDETISISGINGQIKPKQTMQVTIEYANGTKKTMDFPCRIDTVDEVEYFRHGGVMLYVLRNILGQ